MELPLLAYLTCAEILQTLGDELNAKDAIKEGNNLLMELADKISDPSMRQSYLENVPEHQKLIELGNRLFNKHI